MSAATSASTPVTPTRSCATRCRSSTRRAGRWARTTSSFGADYAYGQGDIVNNFRANGRYTFSGGAPFTGDALADFMLGKFSSFEQGIGEYKNTRHAFDCAVRAGQLPRQLEADVEPGPAVGSVHAPIPTTPTGTACYRPGVESQVYTNAPIGAAYPGDDRCPCRRLRRRLARTSARASASPTIRSATAAPASAPATASSSTGQTPSPPTRRPTRVPSARSLTFPGDAANSMTSTYAGRTNPFPADPFNVPADVAFVLPHQMFSYSEDFENGTHADLARDGGARGRPELDGPRRLRGLARARSSGWAARPTPRSTPSAPPRRRPTSGGRCSPTSARSPWSSRPARSTYHSLQLTVDKRFAKGFTVLANYTLSKSLDHSSDNKLNGVTQTNPYDLEFDWGPANFDRRHRARGLVAVGDPGPSGQRHARRRGRRLGALRHLDAGRLACPSP